MQLPMPLAKNLRLVVARQSRQESFAVYEALPNARTGYYLPIHELWRTVVYLEHSGLQQRILPDSVAALVRSPSEISSHHDTNP
jgi:hypothetical protein